MKAFTQCLIVVTIFLIAHPIYCQTAEEYISKAEAFNQSGDLEQAAKVLEEAIQIYPENSTVHSYLGLYRGMMAGRTQDFMEAGRLVQLSFEMLDKAVSLDPINPLARFHRGLMGVNIPEFLGKLDGGIQDLEFLLDLYEKSHENVPLDILVSTYDFLGQGYQKKGETQKAIAAFKKVVELAPGSALATNAENNISKIQTATPQQVVEKERNTSEDVEKLTEQVKADPDNPLLLVQLGRAHFNIGNFDDAEKVLRHAIEKNSTNVEAYKVLIETLGADAGEGYDERIYNDTDLRTNLAFEIVALTDKAVEIAPNDGELRLMRGSIGVMMPFFVQKLDQAIEDLNWVIANETSKELKADALYWLGVAHQKRATSTWIEVITKYKGTEAVAAAFQSMRPSITHFDPEKFTAPFVTIDFVLGFRDELPPQTAVWIEGQNGNFVKTIYVSGFSGHAKEQQVNLPTWSESSTFRDVDAVTAASIDLGHHIYVWDFKDYQGNIVQTGEYIVNVEVAFWPSMQYQSSSARIQIGDKNSKVVVEEGNLIPYLEVKYYSANNH